MSSLKNQISTLNNQLAKASLEEYQEALAEINQFLDLIQGFKQKQTAQKKAEQETYFQSLLKKTKYQAPQYQDYDYDYEDESLDESTAKNGSCYFAEEEEARSLVKLLIEQSYYYGHDLKWAGEGAYKIVPSWRLDHDGEVVYMATYEKV